MMLSWKKWDVHLLTCFPGFHRPCSGRGCVHRQSNLQNRMGALSPPGPQQFWWLMLHFGEHPYHLQGKMQTLSVAVKEFGIWWGLSPWIMMEVATLFRHSCKTHRSVLSASNKSAPANKPILVSYPILTVPFPARLPGLGCTTLTLSQMPTWKKLLCWCCQLPIWQKPTPITKDKQQEQSLTLFFSAVEIMACSTSVCHEGFSLFSLLCWAQCLLAPAEDAESRLRESKKKKKPKKVYQWIFYTINWRSFLPLSLQMAKPICGQLDSDALPSNWMNATLSLTAVINSHPVTIPGWDKNCGVWSKPLARECKNSTNFRMLWFLHWRSTKAMVVSRTGQQRCVCLCPKISHTLAGAVLLECHL